MKLSTTKFLIVAFSLVSICNADINKVGFEFFDHVYSINLKKCTDRREHVIQEFARMNIKNYTIINAVDMDSAEVAEVMRSDFVKKYPPCFRCHKIFCKCFNNVLIKPQIGNWLSFINVFKDIIKNDYEFVLITEDDVKFRDDAAAILNKLINKASMVENNIDLSKPILIRLERRSFVPRPAKIPGFSKTVIMSNACFVVNKLYAESFLKNLTQIDQTSDVYIHFKILEADPTIQHFTAYPQPAYQLSDHAKPKFYSEIHPKGIDAIDLARKKRHKMRMSYFEYLWSKVWS